MSQPQRHETMARIRDATKLTQPTNLAPSPEPSDANFSTALPLQRQSPAPSLAQDSINGQNHGPPIAVTSSSPRLAGSESLNKATHKSRASTLTLSSRQVPTRTASDTLPVKVRAPNPPQPGNMPRTSSIDSAISSLSVTSNPQKPSAELKDPTPEELQTLIATAGSPENLVQHLLKEKLHTAQQNSQLWKLVDKQRALLLGLNKDLERVAKEKDRYKRKLRELQSQVALPNTDQHRKDSQSPVRNGAPEPTLHPSDKVTSTPDNKSPPEYRSSPIDPDILPQPLRFGSQEKPQSQLKRTDTDTSIEESDQEPKTPPRTNNNVPNEAKAQEIPMLNPVPMAPPSNAPSIKLPSLQTSLGLPALNLIEPSPMNEKSGKSFSAARKAPAPLNLKQPKTSTSPLQSGEIALQAPQIDSAGTTDSPPVVRGRRKTREEDEREREIAVLKEQEARSQSKKENQAKPKAEEDEAQQPPTMAPPATVNEQSAQIQPESVAKKASNLMLSPEGAGNITERHLIAPLRSPGLPISPRPGDRPLGSPLPRNPKDIAAPLSALPGSPRIGSMAFPLTPRAPRSAIPLPPGSKLYETSSLDQMTETKYETKQPSHTTQQSPMSPTAEAPSIYRGLMIPAYPDLLLPPNALPSIEIKVASSRIRPSGTNSAAKGQEPIGVFSLSVFSRSDAQELWRLEKSVYALSYLDHNLRPTCHNAPKLPEKRLFEGHAPAVVDARRVGIDSYFDELLDTPMDEKTAVIICKFLSSDAIDPLSASTTRQNSVKSSQSSQSYKKDSKPLKYGYLTKRGKNFGGWKSRYYVLENPELRCFESEGGTHLSTIKLSNAQIGKQSAHSSTTPPPEDPDENEYRHAILILEPKKKDSNSLVKHVLCAENDAERDEWIEALLYYVNQSSSAGPSPPLDKEHESQNGSVELLKGVNYADTVTGNAPVPKSAAMTPSIASPRVGHGFPTGPGTDKGPNISAPMSATLIKDAASWGNKPAAQPKESRMRNIFHFRQRPSTDSQASSLPPADDASHGSFRSKNIASMPVFGLSLSEAVSNCAPIGVDIALPAVVYRCIEYLQTTHAANEEGLFRVSGSSAVIKALKDRFNNEGDIDLLGENQYHDVHAIASLLKMYLRELPPSVLTRELHLDFVRVTELDDHVNKVTAFNTLVHHLPLENFVLLRTLSAYLSEVVSQSSQNKMSVRNLAIVFSPTLNLQVPIITMFLTEFDSIFDQSPSPGAPVQTVGGQTLAPDDIRSPRRQLFTDLPTPAYSQTAFPNGVPHSAFPPTPRSAQMVNQAQEMGLHPLPPSSRTHLSPMPPSASSNFARQTMQPTSSNAAYGSLNHMLAPSDGRNEKSKRRESSMIYM